MATNSSFRALPDDVLQRVLLGVALDDQDATAAACRAFTDVIRGPRFLRLRREYGFAERRVMIVCQRFPDTVEIHVAGKRRAVERVSERVRHDTKEGYVVEARGDLYDVALDGGRVVSVPRSELEPIHRRLSSSGDEKVPDAPPPVEARLSSLTYSEPLPVEAPPALAPPPAYAVPLPAPAEAAPAPAPVYARAAAPPVAEEPRAATPPSYAAPAPAPAAAALPPRAPTPPSYARAATPPVPVPSYARAATPPVPNGREECAVCGRSTAADACSPWNVLTCDVPGCGNEVHTYCTLANPIEEFTCPKCVDKKSLTKHPSLDARIAERRAEFKY
jgi:hypothetical protein